MALSRMAMARSKSKDSCILAFTRWTHAIAQPLPLDNAMISQSAAVLPPPEFQRSINNDISGSMELMAVPKKKDFSSQTWDKKWTKGSAVIIRCNGLRDTDGQNGSTS